MVGGPANPLSLTVSCGIHTQKSADRPDLIDADSIDAVGIRTVDEEEINLVGVVRPMEHAPRVCSGVRVANSITPRRSRPVLDWARRNRPPTSITMSYRWLVPCGISTWWPRLTSSAKMIASLRSPTSTGWRLNSLGGVSSERMFSWYVR